jgi:hypothetical protein
MIVVTLDTGALVAMERQKLNAVRGIVGRLTKLVCVVA